MSASLLLVLKKCFRGDGTILISKSWNVYNRYRRYFYFLVTKGNLTLVFHKGVNSIRAGKSSPLVPTRCLLFLVANGNLTLFVFHMGANRSHEMLAIFSYKW